jgi:hypothetical protein
MLQVARLLLVQCSTVTLTDVAASLDKFSTVTVIFPPPALKLLQNFPSH